MPAKPDFEQLVQTYSNEIFSYLWRIFYVNEDAEDCLQETFLKAFRAYDRFQGPGNPRAWLYRIATNTAYSSLKRDKKFNVSPLEELPSISNPSSSIAEQVETHAMLEAVRSAIDQLPPSQRMALIMRKYQEMSYREIALALDCSPEAARANVYQGLRKLRQQFSSPSENEINP